MNDKILNPDTGRYVDANGTIGRKIKATEAYQENQQQEKELYKLENDKFLVNEDLLDHCIRLDIIRTTKNSNNGGCGHCNCRCDEEVTDETEYLRIPRFITSLDYKLELYKDKDLTTFVYKLMSKLNVSEYDYGYYYVVENEIDDISFQPCPTDDESSDNYIKIRSVEEESR